VAAKRKAKAKAGFFAALFGLLVYVGHAAYAGHAVIDVLGWHDEITWVVHKGQHVLGFGPKPPAIQDNCNAPGDCPFR
jgi:hypothetical protein